MSTSVITKTIEQLLRSDSIKNQIAQVLPKHMTAERVCRIALSECQRNAALKEADSLSLLRAIMISSTLGLEIGNGLHQAYLVPYKKQVQFIPGYRGLLELARRSPDVISIFGAEVCENDIFEHERGSTTFLRHIPARRNRGKLIEVYSYIKLHNNAFEYMVMNLDECYESRNKSASYQYACKSGKPSIWQEYEKEMCIKTVIRKFAKYIPMSIEFQKASIMDEIQEAGKEVIDGDYFDLGLDIVDEPIEIKKSTTEKLTEILT